MYKKGNKDYVGRLVERFESGKDGCYSHSQCGNDWGLSLGTNQRILRYGISIKFLKKYFSGNSCVDSLYFNEGKDVAVSYYPGQAYCSSPTDVQNAWNYCINKVGKIQFEQYEYADILEKYYYPCCSILKPVLDINTTNRAYQEMVFAGSILYGAETYAKKILAIINSGKFRVGEDPAKLFNLVYDSCYADYGWMRHSRHKTLDSEWYTLRPYLTELPLEGEGEESRMKIMIDPGHYGDWYNQGANPNYWESRFAWNISLKLGAYLQNAGFQVGFTRIDKNANPGLVERGQMAARYDLFISLHSNAVDANAWAKKEEIDYPVAYCMVTDNRFTFDEVSRDIGIKLAQGVREVLQTKQPAEVYQWHADWDRDGDGILNDNYLGVLHGARMAGVPGIVLEHSFHTNTAMCNKLLDESVVDRLAKKDAEVIAAYFGIYMEPTVTMTSFWVCDMTVTALGNMPAYSDAALIQQVGTINAGEKWRAIQRYTLSNNRSGARLENGVYINAIAGIEMVDNVVDLFVGTVSSPDGILNVRDFPNSNGSSILYQLYNGNLVDVVGDCYNNGDHWYLVHIKNQNVNLRGFVAAKYLMNV